MAETGRTDDQAALSASVKLDTAARDDLASKLSDQFDKAFSSDDGEAAPEVETTEVAETTEGEPAAETETPAEETTEGSEAASEEKPGEQPAADSGLPILPAAYRRSLKGYEWTDDEIDAALKQGGQSFVTTASKLHQNRNTELARWADAGRAARQQQQAPGAQSAQPSTQQRDNDDLSPVDVAALKAKVGDEELAAAIVDPINRVVERTNRVAQQVRESQYRAQQAELETLNKQINQFFGGKELEPYKEVYGAGAATDSQGQMAARNKVLEYADALIGGARLQGRQLSNAEALQMAHDSVTGPIKDQAARTKLVAQVKQRERGITMKPNARGTGTGQSKPAGRSELEKRVQMGLRKAFA
jgi:hypothetical protein